MWHHTQISRLQCLNCTVSASRYFIWSDRGQASRPGCSVSTALCLLSRYHTETACAGKMGLIGGTWVRHPSPRPPPQAAVTDSPLCLLARCHTQAACAGKVGVTGVRHHAQAAMLQLHGLCYTQAACAGRDGVGGYRGQASRPGCNDFTTVSAVQVKWTSWPWRKQAS